MNINGKIPNKIISKKLQQFIQEKYNTAKLTCFCRNVNSSKLGNLLIWFTIAYDIKRKNSYRSCSLKLNRQSAKFSIHSWHKCSLKQELINPQNDKYVYLNPREMTMFNGKPLSASSLELGTKQGCMFLPLFPNSVLRYLLIYLNKRKKEI